MAVHLRLDEFERKIQSNPDEPALSFLPEGSLARDKYEQGIAYAERPNEAADADAAECSRYGLTPEEWSEEMKAALHALRHDAKLDMVQRGVGRV